MIERHDLLLIHTHMQASMQMQMQMLCADARGVSAAPQR